MTNDGFPPTDQFNQPPLVYEALNHLDHADYFESRIERHQQRIKSDLDEIRARSNPAEFFLHMVKKGYREYRIDVLRKRAEHSRAVAHSLVDRLVATELEPDISD